ncbi:MAG: hypothetical protein V1867_04305 [Candidatus Falkowbacteria bacterium]
MDHAKGELLVAFKDGVSETAAENLLKFKGLTVLEKYALCHGFLVGVPPGEEIKWLNVLVKEPLIASVDLNVIMKLC